MTQSLWCLIRFVSLGMFLACASLSAQPKSEPTLPWVRNLVSNPGVIVFVHGVTGDDRETWSSGTQFWPSMISRDPAFNGQNIYVYRYPSPRFGHTLSVDEVAENMRLMLKTDGVLKQSQITFVSHSLGGIVTRAFLVKYQREIAPKIRFLYFFATPTTGTQFAKLASFFSKNSQFKQLLPLDSDNYLGTLQSNWLAAGLRIKSYCAYETQPLHGQTIVERASATNLCTEPLDPIEADHINIVKPTSPSSTSYRALKAAFEETSPTHSRPVPNRVASGRPSTPSASVRTPPARSGKDDVSRAVDPAKVPNGSGISYGQQGGQTAATINNYGPIPVASVFLPKVKLSTQEGLTPTDFPDHAISPEMLKTLRRHNLVLKNENSFELSNVTIRFQFPEAVFGALSIEDRPAGVEVTWHACRIPFSLSGAGASSRPTPDGATEISTGEAPGSEAVFRGGGEVCSVAMNDSRLRPTKKYKLAIGRVPANSVIRLGFMTVMGDEFPPFVDSPGALAYWGLGLFQYVSGNSIEARNFLVPLDFDRRQRTITAQPVEGKGRPLQVSWDF